MKLTIHWIAAAALALGSAACTSAGDREPVRPYPFTTCLVTDNALGSMGDPITLVYEGQELKFCCSPCVDEFKADPAKFLAKLHP
jgi:hypothetical protein